MAGPDAVVAMRTRAAEAQESSLMVAEGTLTGLPPASARSAVVARGWTSATSKPQYRVSNLRGAR